MQNEQNYNRVDDDDNDNTSQLFMFGVCEIVIDFMHTTQ